MSKNSTPLHPKLTPASLSKELSLVLTSQHILSPSEAVKYHREQDAKTVVAKQSEVRGGASLFDFATEESLITPNSNHSRLLTETVAVIWGTNNHLELGERYASSMPLHDPYIIRNRTQKTVAEQKRRVKEKAEVFTPSWVCNLQNNLVDDAILGEHSFNQPSDGGKSWVSDGVVDFSVLKDGWITYLTSPRLEMCCGEGPYLFSPYDAVTAQEIPVFNEQGWQRVGVLDRKLRAVHENTNSWEEWRFCSLVAVRATYGFEWSGDNLIIARVNLVNTVIDYLDYYLMEKKLKSPPDREVKELVTEVAGLASWQLWQMDGLKQVVPETCSSSCASCAKKKRFGHDGLLPVIKWGKTEKVFDSFIPRF